MGAAGFSTSRKAADRYDIRVKRVLRDRPEMFVVCEEKNLGLAGDLTEDLEAGMGASIVEIDEEIVRQEREGDVGVERLFQGGQPER